MRLARGSRSRPIVSAHRAPSRLAVLAAHVVCTAHHRRPHPRELHTSLGRSRCRIVLEPGRSRARQRPSPPQQVAHGATSFRRDACIVPDPAPECAMSSYGRRSLRLLRAIARRTGAAELGAGRLSRTIVVIPATPPRARATREGPRSWWECGVEKPCSTRAEPSTALSFDSAQRADCGYASFVMRSRNASGAPAVRTEALWMSVDCAWANAGPRRRGQEDTHALKLHGMRDVAISYKPQVAHLPTPKLAQSLSQTGRAGR